MKVEKRDDVTILSTGFRLDAVNEQKLKETVQEIAHAGQTKVILDMKQTRHIDSSGLSTLISCQKVLSAHQGDMKIARATRRVRNLLELTKVDRLLKIHESLEGAVKAFS